MLRKSLLISLLLLGGASAFAAETPALDERQENQKERIQQGVQSGELTKPEAKRLVRSERRLERHEDKAKEDGTVTAGERARLQREASRDSKRIHRQKHDRQDRN